MCGIFGAYGVLDAAEVTMRGLHGNQHRATDFAGIVSTDGHDMFRHAAPGIARDVFYGKTLAPLRGRGALGHLRYPTVEDRSEQDNTQPVLRNWHGTPFAVAHNGNLTNVQELADMVKRRTTAMDTELIARLIEMSDAGNIEGAILESLKELRGSFELGILLPDRLIAVRSPRGNRPLSIGRLGEGFVISSETTALDTLGAHGVEDVQSGTMVIMDNGRTKILNFAPEGCEEKRCIFELVYYALPSSRVFDVPVSEFRYRSGIKLEQVCPAEGADVVIGVPDSANFIAQGYGESGRSGVFCGDAILRSHFTARNFLLDSQRHREDDIALKHYFNTAAIKGKKVVVVDDSLVRGTTLRWLVVKLRELGAREVHVRIACPPVRHPCRYGINTREEGELIANRVIGVRLVAYLGATSIEFLPMEELRGLVGDGGWCDACWTGNYWDLPE